MSVAKIKKLLNAATIQRVALHAAAEKVPLFRLPTASASIVRMERVLRGAVRV
eukprot:COSAG04_NODE_15789_length_520_cov_0.973872_1_plen_53_part_00